MLKLLKRMKTLLLKKKAEEAVTEEIINRALAGDEKAMNFVADNLLKLLHSAINQLGIMQQVPYDVWTDFRDKTLERILSYSLEKFDESKGKFSTFIFNNVKNMWINYAQKLQRERTVSLDAPVEEGEGKTTTLSDILEDPGSTEFIGETKAQAMYNSILENIKNPKYRDVFQMWLGSEAAGQARREEIAEAINKKYPQSPITPYRVYRIITDIIQPLVLSMYPEASLPTYEFQEPQPVEEVAEEPAEEETAPAYRIDPQTGERTRIGLTMKKRRITSREENWFYTLMDWIRIEKKAWRT